MFQKCLAERVSEPTLVVDPSEQLCFETTNKTYKKSTTQSLQHLGVKPGLRLEQKGSYKMRFQSRWLLFRRSFNAMVNFDLTVLCCPYKIDNRSVAATELLLACLQRH